MKKSTLVASLLVLVGSVPGFAQTTPARPVVVNPRVENLTNPAGLEMSQPRLSWEITSTARAVMQTKYRILVADDWSKLVLNTGNIWDSKEVASEQSLLVPYGGAPLKAGQTYYWKVMVWDNQGQLSEYTRDTARFTMGLMQPADWSNAQWIGYDELDAAKRYVPGVHAPGANKEYKSVVSGNHVLPLLRKSFNVNKPVKKATAFITGLGQYELHINGVKIGDQFMSPGWTNYDKRVLYDVLDVTSQVANGDNAIGVMLGNGFYNIPNERYRKALLAYGNPKMIMKLLIEYADGSKSEVISDNSWKTAPSPITFSSIYAGEEYNATLEQDGWDKAAFNDGSWKAAIAVKAPAGKLVAETGTPVKVMQTFAPQTCEKNSDTTVLFDFGQNASGIIKITVRGQKGQVVRIFPAELLGEEKRINQKNSGKPYFYSYTCKGTGDEEWTPRFSYYGFRYAEVSYAAPDSIKSKKLTAVIKDIKMLHTRNSAPQIGKFDSREDLMNDTYSLIDWAIRSNMQSVLSDCPHREKLGWLEQSYLMGESIHFNYDIYSLYKKIIADMMADQTTDGLVPDIAPEYVLFDGGFRDSPEWGSAAVILPYLIYQWYGDKTVMQEAWPMMTKYVAYLKSKASGNILSHGLGDWYDLGPKFPGVAQLTPKELTATAIYYYDIDLLTKMAKLMGKSADATQYASLAADVKKSFNAKFYDAASHKYSTGSQTAMSMPLAVGLVEDANKAAVLDQLKTDIITNESALTAGDIGFHFLVDALTKNGSAQFVYDMNSDEKVPGYGYQLKKGATALTESWAALPEVSNDHLMLGHLMQWFYDGVGGIHQEDTSVAYKNIIINPEPIMGLEKGSVSFNSPYGRIYSEWDHQYVFHVFTIQVPPNTTATIYLPTPPMANIMESNSPMNLHKEIKLVGYEKGRTIFKVGSGKYKFIIKKG
ncbi:alpha-L-rhamnosidase [Niastella yeongjuensis]|uniref:alpha-L-rhamnosidase n=1 Tax=Niastella yeongjuensis TaxID=354355 RepID=A0A1V9DXX4_9BACT|nr:family 78 glycoside hydrolase catalytic domain [Niastella yeongjuensis]OQP38727.1 alpha-L-rhamnosidase [Niastella yeongjuensis]SEO34898.1 Alpha-L-rhamnosidase N-terminal domain-containing protein [Niastella yeongjuensis]